MFVGFQPSIGQVFPGMSWSEVRGQRSERERGGGRRYESWCTTDNCGTFFVKFVMRLIIIIITLIPEVFCFYCCLFVDLNELKPTLNLNGWRKKQGGPEQTEPSHILE